MISVERLSKFFAGRAVFEDVDLVVPDGETVVILGPSGIGKSVLLRVMAGLLPADAGRVTYDGVPLRHGAFADNQPILARLGYVFQGGALFDSLSVFDNIALPLRENGVRDEAAVRERVRAVLARTGMETCERMMPSELSGGMVRLVAIGRALTADPKWVFYDEPTTGLDPLMRVRILDLITDLRDVEGRTGVVVTHDLEAAERVANRIYMLRDRRLFELAGARKEHYEMECP
ncbi:MAG TPA: ATP-binding cassette domain-containing protein [candidate division WOR-3 bacterium]|uniref:ATP-binding cassette domain-containing protein n=1 Tax=candidate division WOR-3 bacterium TaxID=2052148 RepID=A0A7V0T408_UNCW3|nr:ATP-binding cassette domain-containing protein [candidate division WOR-3 bacterium]